MISKIITTILVLGIFVSFSFGYWGMYTKSGAKRFDEMDGMIPFLSLCLSGLLILILIVYLTFFLPKK